MILLAAFLSCQGSQDVQVDVHVGRQGGAGQSQPEPGTEPSDDANGEETASPDTGGAQDDGWVDFQNPPEFVSEDGVLSVELHVDFADNSIPVNSQDGTRYTKEIYTRTYNGMVPGPTLRMKPGERLDIRLFNDLPENEDEFDSIMTMNLPHHLNSTNLHTHGLHVDPTGISDNIQRVFPPGSEAEIQVDVQENHNAGSFWYHGHKHGANVIQFLSGMSGALILEGDIDEVPEVAAAEEKILVFQEFGLDETGRVPAPNLESIEPEGLFPVSETYLAVSGAVNPVVRMRPGEVQRWRMINGNVGHTLDLVMTDHDFHVLGFDGITYNFVRSVARMELAQGNRADILVEAGEPGVYQLTAPIILVGHSDAITPEEYVFLTLVVEGEPMEMELPFELPAPTELLPDTRTDPDGNALEPAASRLIVLEEKSSAIAGYNRFSIDGTMFDPTCVNQIAQRGDLEEWEVHNLWQLQ